MKLDKPVNVTVGDYTFDIAPILNVLFAFVGKILDMYLPEEFNEILGE